MIKFVICNNNPNEAEHLGSLITNYMKYRNMLYGISMYNTGEELLESKCKIDVLFIEVVQDIIDGIYISKKIRTINCNIRVIYTLSSDQYIKMALNKGHAFAYLTKPISVEDFEVQMDDIIHSTGGDNGLGLVHFKVFKITEDGKIDINFMDFNVDDICCFEYINRKIKIITEHEEFYFTSQMKDLVNMMEEYNFANCHKNFLVNLKWIQQVKGYTVYLKNSSRLPISQKKSNQFRKKLNVFYVNKI